MVVLLFTIFPVLINTMRGVREVDPRLVEVARAFCSTEYRLWIDLVLPSALPFMMTGIRLAIGRALIAVIVAEFYTAIAGLDTSSSRMPMRFRRRASLCRSCSS